MAQTPGRFAVGMEKEQALADRWAALGLREDDIDEKFVRSAGPGGQNVNKVSTCVQLTHRPTGIAVRCQSERTQALNRFLARRRLADKLEELRTGRIRAEQARREKIRRQKRKRSKRAQEKILATKHHQSRKKANRRAGGDD
ncbi:MAG TPA: peptide chain release factor-like protein [bacterium]|nr:peptide chain release factor-like protein [bacterium]